MSSRPMSATMLAALDAPILFPVYFFQAEFASGTVYLWTGIGDKSWNGHTWKGVGWVLGFSEVQETTEIRATNMTISLSGVAPEVLALVLNELRQNKPCTLWQGLLSPPAEFGTFATPPNQLIVDPFQAFAGRLDMGEYDKNPEKPAIRFSYESRLRDLLRPRVFRYTDEDQQRDFPGDRFFEFVGALTDKTLVWGGGGDSSS